ncbi:MAG: hypothetical protein OEZ06_27535 [Myxococcales bacterium]|nr:hypothetical protein [Myxococcales bacterium]
MDDATFLPRLGLGVGLLAGIALYEHRRGRGSDKIREYGFLFGSGLVGAGYALLHDLCTHGLSPDYFAIGKGLESAARGFWPDVAWLATRAGWSAGLVIGCALLRMNNPQVERRRLGYASLVRALTWPLAASLLFAFIGAWLGPNLLDSEFDTSALHRPGVTDPSAFLTVWGIHIGSYAGALLGLLVAASRIRRARRKPKVPGTSAGGLSGDGQLHRLRGRPELG